MKTAALFLYPLCALIAALGGINGDSFFMFCLFATIVTVFLGIAQLLVWLITWAQSVNRQQRGRVDDKKWIL